MLTRRALGRAHLPLTKVFPRLTVNKTILKYHASLQRRAPNTYTWDFPNVIKFRVAAHTISEKAIRFRHPDYNPDRAQKLISSSMSRHLSTRNISSKYMHAFFSNLANRRTETDKRPRANALTSSFVGSSALYNAMRLRLAQQADIRRAYLLTYLPKFSVFFSVITFAIGWAIKFS